jgi:Short C-terminal domain
MEDIMKTIERLAELRQKNILTEEEFVAKKVELLGRL